VVDETLYIVTCVVYFFKSNSENGTSSFFDEVTDKNPFQHQCATDHWRI